MLLYYLTFFWVLWTFAYYLPVILFLASTSTFTLDICLSSCGPYVSGEGHPIPRFTGPHWLRPSNTLYNLAIVFGWRTNMRPSVDPCVALGFVDSHVATTRKVALEWVRHYGRQNRDRGWVSFWTFLCYWLKLNLKLPTSAGSSKKQESFRKTSISALLTMPKPLTVWITINCGKSWKRWEYQTTWPASWETCMQVRKQQLELDMEQQTGSK